jgi:hypothetical protein
MFAKRANIVHISFFSPIIEREEKGVKLTAADFYSPPSGTAFVFVSSNDCCLLSFPPLNPNRSPSCQRHRSLEPLVSFDGRWLASSSSSSSQSSCGCSMHRICTEHIRNQIRALGGKIMLGTRAARRDPTSRPPNHGETATSMWVCCTSTGDDPSFSPIQMGIYPTPQNKTKPILLKGLAWPLLLGCALSFHNHSDTYSELSWLDPRSWPERTQTFSILGMHARILDRSRYYYCVGQLKR